MVLKHVVVMSGLLVAGISTGFPARGAHHSAPLERTAHDRASPGLQSAGEETFLGFRLGEEIRYALEGADDRPLEIHMIWGIRLEESDRDTGVFELMYEAGVPGRPAGAGQARGGVLVARTTATAWVNAHGFPTRVRFTTQRDTPMGGIGYTVEYRYEDRRFVKELEGSGKEQDLELDDVRTIDPGAPAGMYLFMPIDAECVAGERQTRGGGGTGGSGVSPPGGGTGGGVRGRSGARAEMEPLCGGREPVFANPGLLNLTMPALWESGTGTLEFVAMAPTGVLPAVLLGPSNPAGSGISVGGYNLLGGGGPNPFGDAEDALRAFVLAAENELMRLDVGGRSVDVWRLRTPPPLDVAYVDGNGSIARLDLPADPESGERLWIRRLRPSEY